MSPVARRGLAALLLGASLLSGLAGAQDLGAYRATTGALDRALRDRPSSPVRSLSDVDAATAAFERLARSLTGSVVLDGTRVAIKNARIAVGRSQTDLEGQVAQVRGLLRRALYEQLLADLPRATPEALSLLAQDFVLSAADRAALLTAAREGQPDLVTALLERAASVQVSQSLERAEPASPSRAYLETARALSWFTAVQDSPRAAGLKVEDFAAALGQVTGRQPTAFARTRSTLLARASRFEATAAQAVAAARRGAALPSGAPSPAPAPAGRPAPTPAATVRPSTSGGTDVALLSALNAAGHGDTRAAQDALGSAVLTLGSLPGAVQQAPGYPAFADGLRAAAALPFVRPADVRAQQGALSNLRAEAARRPVSALDAASAGVQRVWGGWLSGAVWLLLALAAFYPLYLLNLAFGGRNPYWRAIGAAFGLLLLPAMLEGLASLGAWLGAVSGFGSLANLSLLGSPLAGPLWALTVAAAVGLGIYGFRGLCVQFGLLRGPGPGPRAAQATQSTVEWDEEV